MLKSPTTSSGIQRCGTANGGETVMEVSVLVQRLYNLRMRKLGKRHAKEVSTKKVQGNDGWAVKVAGEEGGSSMEIRRNINGNLGFGAKGNRRREGKKASEGRKGGFSSRKGSRCRQFRGGTELRQKDQRVRETHPCSQGCRVEQGKE